MLNQPVFLMYVPILLGDQNSVSGLTWAIACDDDRIQASKRICIVRRWFHRISIFCSLQPDVNGASRYLGASGWKMHVASSKTASISRICNNETILILIAHGDATTVTGVLPEMNMARVLVIDDQEAVRDGLRRTLEMHGYQVLTAPDGKRGLQQIEQQRPDLVLTDIFMPEMEGLETIKRISQLAPELPIIVMTGSTWTPFLKAGIKFGAVSGLYKPFTPEELLAAVRQALSHQPSS